MPDDANAWLRRNGIKGQLTCGQLIALQSAIGSLPFVACPRPGERRAHKEA